MAAWLIAAIERLPPRVRRIMVAATLLLLVGGAVASLAPEADPGRDAPVGWDRAWSLASTLRAAGASSCGPAGVRARSAHRRPGCARVPRLVSEVRVRQGERDFGEGATSGLRGQLVRDRARVTPAVRGRRPRVVALEVLGTAPGVVLATALVDDGGITTYPLRVTLRAGRAGWLVSGENGG